MIGITGSPRGALRSPNASSAFAIDVAASIGSRRITPAGNHDTLRFSNNDAAARRALFTDAVASLVFLELFLLEDEDEEDDIDLLFEVEEFVVVVVVAVDDDVDGDEDEVRVGVALVVADVVLVVTVLEDEAPDSSRFDFDFFAVGGDGNGSPTRGAVNGTA